MKTILSLTNCIFHQPSYLSKSNIPMKKKCINKIFNNESIILLKIEFFWTIELIIKENSKNYPPCILI